MEENCYFFFYNLFLSKSESMGRLQGTQSIDFDKTRFITASILSRYKINKSKIAMKNDDWLPPGQCWYYVEPKDCDPIEIASLCRSKLTIRCLQFFNNLIFTLRVFNRSISFSPPSFYTSHLQPIFSNVNVSTRTFERYEEGEDELENNIFIQLSVCV